jgi:hypothetical protein
MSDLLLLSDGDAIKEDWAGLCADGEESSLNRRGRDNRDGEESSLNRSTNAPLFGRSSPPSIT